MTSLFEAEEVPVSEPPHPEAPPGVRIHIPPSANKLWQVFQNRLHKSTQYKAWLKEASLQLASQMQPLHIKGIEVELTLVRGKGFTESRDLDNLIKPVLDCLKPEVRDRYNKVESEGAGIILDDNVNYVRRILIQSRPPHDKKSDAEFWVDVRPFKEDR